MTKTADKERLEYIKHRIRYMFYRNNRDAEKKPKFLDDILWLIEQAEKGIRRDEK